MCANGYYTHECVYQLIRSYSRFPTYTSRSLWRKYKDGEYRLHMQKFKSYLSCYLHDLNYSKNSIRKI